MSNLEDLEKRLKNIEDRNKKVEKDKAWETSLSRKILLITFTYLSIGFYLKAINIDRPWFNAIVPALGFFFSTLTLPYFKNLWLKFVKKVENGN